METVSKLPYSPTYPYGLLLLPKVTSHPPTPASGSTSFSFSSHTSLGSRFALCHQSVDDFQRCQLAHNFVVANGQRDVCGGREGEGGNEQQLCRLGVIKIYAWTAA